MKKLIACLLVLSMLLGGMILAIGAADEKSEPERVPAEHGPVTEEDLNNGLVAVRRTRGTNKQIGDNLYCQVYWYSMTKGGTQYFEAVITGSGTMNDYRKGLSMINTDTTKVSRVFIADGTTNIGAYAFNGMGKLEYVSIPDSVKTIGDHAFYGTAVSNVKLPDSITSIGDYGFAYCNSLISVELPDELTSIGEYAFFRCSKLAVVDMGAKVETIGERAFAYDPELTALALPDSITEMGDYIFLSSGVKNLRVPAAINYVSENTFSGNRAMETIELHDGIT